MSQNPNYNPYQNPPPDPNQGTAYGSPPPGQGQNPYSPGTNPNPYGPYPPNPPTPTPPGNPNYDPYNPYAQNPPSPPPPTDPNYPYDPYAPTVISGRPGTPSSPNYNPYAPESAPPAAPVSPPQAPRRRGGPSPTVFVLIGLALLLIIGGAVFGVLSYQRTQTENANATATAQANATATQQAILTATANAAASATAIASNYPFSANLKLSDPLSDNSKGYGWQTSSSCRFLGNAYHITDMQTNTYQPCAALNTDFKDFTYEVEMNIIKGDGGGMIFRADNANNKIYDFVIFQNGFYAINIYSSPTGTGQTVRSGNTSALGLNQANVIAIVARGSTISIYINKLKVDTVVDSTYSHGQIGLLAYDQNSPTEVVYTNAKVWELPPAS